MKELPSPESGIDTTQNVQGIPQQLRGSSTEAALPQTTAGTNPDCVVDRDKFAEDTDKRGVELEPETVQTLRRVGAKLRGLVED